MSKNINFIYTSEYAWENIEKAKPASSFVPKWHRDMIPYHGGSLKIINGESTATPKKCVPMLDAITAGYIVPLWSDILIEERIEDGVTLSWRVSENVFEGHGPSSNMVPAPDGYHPSAFKYMANLTIETPKGYSVLVTQPAGHYDLPFFAIPAIIDCDRPTLDFAFPVWIKKGVNGIVEKGTPVVQIIPFKRENWNSKFNYITKNQFIFRVDKVFNSTIKNNYFKNVWSRKEYK